MTTLGQQIGSALLAAAVCAIGIAVYDVTVRQPRTPRLALVDIAKLYTAADQALKARALAGEPAVRAPLQFSGAGEGAGTPSLSPGLRQGADFGPALESVLTGLADECRCAIVAMATVFGSDSTLPDFTQEAGRRLGLALGGAANAAGGPAR
jgi:hypothetical protein